MLVLISVTTSLILLSACASEKAAEKEVTADPTGRYWIAGNRVPCSVGATKLCYQIQREDTLVAGSWKMFPNTINGLDYEEGTLYHVRLKQVGKETYDLVELINSTPDIRSALKHTYVLTKVNGAPIQVPGTLKTPSLKFDFDKKELNGNDGCNTFNAPNIDVSRGGDFGIRYLTSTEMACDHQAFSQAFLDGIANTKRFDLRGDEMLMRNDEGKVLMRLKKAE